MDKEKAINPKKKIKYLRYPVLILMMFVTCSLKAWFALPLIFMVGLTITLFSGKRVYCSSLCPMGTIQDWAAESQKSKENRQPKRKFPPMKKGIKRIWYFLFWGYLAAVTVLFFGEWGSLWAAFLRLMLLSLASALILQTVYGRRTWCGQICPLGKVMVPLAKVRK